MQLSVSRRRWLALLTAVAAAVIVYIWYLTPAWYAAQLGLPVADLSKVCPPGRFVTISPGGRLGNKLCQYASLWARQLDDPTVRPALILPEMHAALTPLFAGLALPALPDVCARHTGQFYPIGYHIYDKLGPGPLGQPIYLTQNPCDIRRFSRLRAELLEQLTFRPEVVEDAQWLLRRHTAALCRGPPACTYVGVHVRRTDYGKQVKLMYNGRLAGEAYLTRALALCRRRYRRPVFVVSSDDLAWVRQKLRGPDVVIAGSRGPDSAGRDLALLAQCNHTVMTHGTYGFMAAFLARGDVLVPTGFGDRESWLTGGMRQGGVFNLTSVPVQ